MDLCCAGHRDDGSRSTVRGHRSGDVEPAQENRPQGPALRRLRTQMVRTKILYTKIAYFFFQATGSTAHFCFTDKSRSYFFGVNVKSTASGHLRSKTKAGASHRPESIVRKKTRRKFAVRYSLHTLISPLKVKLKLRLYNNTLSSHDQP